MSIEGGEINNPSTGIPEGQPSGGTDAVQQSMPAGLDHFGDVNKLAESYKSLQSVYTQSQQSLKQLEQQYQDLHSRLAQQDQFRQQAQPQERDYLNMPHDQLLAELNEDVTGTLKSLLGQYVSQWEAENLKPLKSQTEEMNQFVTQMQVQSSLYQLRDKFGNMPDFEQNLKADGEYLTSQEGQWLLNSPQALENANNLMVSQKVYSPDYLQQLAQSYGQYQQGVAQQKQMAMPLTSNPNGQVGSHQPLTATRPQVLSAAEIAGYSDNIFTQGNQFKVIR